MNKQVKIIMILFAGAAAFVNLAPMPTGVVRKQEWLTAQMPKQISDFNYRDSYKMSDEVWQTLEPFGIVSNIYSNGNETFDATIISSNQQKSFHDPRVCFTSQGMEILNESTETVSTRSHGDIPLTVVQVRKGGGDILAAYTYQGPGQKMISSPNRLMNQMFLKALTTMRPQEGVFYRFISQDAGTTKESLKEFIVKFFDAADKSSNGYL